MRKIFPLLLIVIAVSACQKNIKDKNVVTPTAEPQDQKMSAKEINSIIMDKFTQTGSFDWKDATDRMLWSALQNSDKIVSIGYKPSVETNIDDRISTININIYKREDVINKLTTTAGNYPTKIKVMGWVN